MKHEQIFKATTAYVIMFEDYYNNFLTVERFAEYYECSIQQARRILAKGRTLRQDKFGHH